MGPPDRHELDRQVGAYVELGYPDLCGMPEPAFRALFEPAIEAALAARPPPPSAVLVVTRVLIDPELRVPLLKLAGSRQSGLVDKNHWSDPLGGLAPYRPLPSLGVPDEPVYALLGVERGDEFRNVAPEQAVSALEARGRTPLTIDEGISLAALFPEVLEKNHCFMLAGSDRGDRRMPALWISEKAPKLGWCFKGNPHSWLGVASASARVP